MGLISSRMTIGPLPLPCSSKQVSPFARESSRPGPSWNGAKARRQAAFDRGQLDPRPAAARAQGRDEGSPPQRPRRTHVSRLLGACLANGFPPLPAHSVYGVPTDHPVQFPLEYFIYWSINIKQKRRAKCKSHLGRHRRRGEI